MSASGSARRTAPRAVHRNARYAHIDLPGPMPLEMIGAVPRVRADPLAYLAELVDRHGDLVALPMPRGVTLLVNDPDDVRRVLVDHHRNYGKATVQYSALSEITGSGLLTAEADVWRPHRTVLQPGFRHDALAGLADHATAVAAELRARWDAAPGRLLDVDGAVMAAMLDLVGRTLFVTDLGADGVVPGQEILDAVDVALRLVVSRSASPVPRSWPTPARARLRRAIARLEAAAAEIVAARRAVGIGADDGDLLALLLRAQDVGALTATEVRDEVLTLVIAGHETVASSLIWTLDLLARHPDVQDALATEFETVLGSSAGGSVRVPTWADLPALRLTRAVVDEALRLYPPAWVITRRSLGPDELGGVPIPAGTLVIMSPWLLHRRRDAWPDPERFDPGRFLGTDRAVPRGDYLPFGLGPRLCIGRETALVEAVLVLATLLPGRRVAHPAGPAHPAGHGPATPQALVTVRPRGGLPLTFLRGDHAEVS